MRPQRSYWHLDGFGRVPSDYDIGSTRLLHYPGRGFEVATPGADWYRRHQQGWWPELGGCATFRDPRETTYARYTELQSKQEGYVDGLLRSMQHTAYDRELPPSWLTQLECWLPVLRFPCHALQMLAAYVGQMAPESRVVIACCFQSGDEMRRIQRIAYRMRQLQEVRPTFGAHSKRDWQHADVWQPLRALIERLLVTYDAGGAFVGSSLVLKPMFDRLFMHEFAQLAEQSHDLLLGRILASLADDCLWHRQWARALVVAAVEASPGLREALGHGLGSWYEPTLAALAALEPLWTSTHRPWVAVLDAVCRDCHAFWDAAGIGVEATG